MCFVESTVIFLIESTFLNGIFCIKCQIFSFSESRLFWQQWTHIHIWQEATETGACLLPSDRVYMACFISLPSTPWSKLLIDVTNMFHIDIRDCNSWSKALARAICRTMLTHVSSWGLFLELDLRAKWIESWPSFSFLWQLSPSSIPCKALGCPPGKPFCVMCYDPFSSKCTCFIMQGGWLICVPMLMN